MKINVWILDWRKNCKNPLIADDFRGFESKLLIEDAFRLSDNSVIIVWDTLVNQVNVVLKGDMIL